MARHYLPHSFAPSSLGLALTLCSLSAGAATFTVTNLNDSGPGSLRQAILDADVATGDDTIVFQSGLSGTITLTSGNLIISSGNLNINGPGTNTLMIEGDGDKTFRKFVIGLGATVSVDGLTIMGNNSLYNNGGIYNNGMLTVTNCTLSGNVDTFGGGIENVKGTLTVTNSTLSGNRVFNIGHGFSSGFGGGIANYYGTVTISNSTLSGNSADNQGGGIYNYQGTLTVTNSTLSGNFGLHGGGISNNQGTLTITNSILSGNKEVNSYVVNAGIFTSQGHNLFGENGVSGVEGGTLAASDIVPAVGIDAILAPLGNNGGPTQTHLLVPGSPAINAGDNALIPSGVTTDQRGFPRIQGGTVDIGAVETGETSTTDIPTLNQWALLFAGGLLVGMAWLAQVRRTHLPRG